MIGKGWGERAGLMSSAGRVLAMLTAPLAVAAATAAEAGVITGRVRDAGTGAALQGAAIRVQGLDRGAVTDRDGAFTIPNVPEGSYQLQANYLGYERVTVRVDAPAEGAAEVSLQLRQTSVAGALAEVVVTGVRLGQARALNEQRTADGIVSVQSADEAGKFPDNNVAESLARLPGVSLVRDQQTAEGELVTIRGLDAGLNVFTLNGVRLAQANPDNRQISLGTLPPLGLQAMKVSKTVMPDMDGDAIGGTVDFRTPTAFDFNKRVVGVGLQATYNDRKGDWGKLGQVEFGDVFGPDKQFGFYVSGYWSDRDTHSEESENEGDWEPYAWRRDGVVPVDDRSYQMQGLGLDLYDHELERWGGNFSLDWRGDSGSKLYLRGQYGKYTKNTVHDYLDVRNERTPARLLQTDLDERGLPQPDSYVLETRPDGVRVYRYTPGQIVDQDGDGLITDADRIEEFENGSTDRLYSLIGASGVWDPQAYFVNRGFDTSNRLTTLGTVNAGGVSQFDALTLEYDLAYSFGEYSDGFNYGVGYHAGGQAPYTRGGAFFSFPDSRFPMWNLPGNDYGGVYDLALFAFDGASASSSTSEDKKYQARFDARYELADGFFDYVKAGGKFVRSERKKDETRLFDGDLGLETLADAEARGLLGSEYGDVFGQYQGERRYGRTFDASAWRELIERNLDPSAFSLAEQSENDAEGREDVLAAYAMAKAQHGDWEFFGGVRVEHTSIENTYWQSDEAGSGFATSSSDYTHWLPSLHVNYRPRANLVFRGAIWTSISRPEFQYVAASSSVTRDGANNIIAISRGNPDLKPAEALNFDLGAEWYSSNVGLASINFYYKDIENFIFTSNANETTQNVNGVEISQPENGDKARLFGVEMGLQQQLRWLPDPYDGLGFALNLTLQSSEAETGVAYRRGRKVDLINAPEIQGNASIFYEKHGFQARLAYNYNGKYIEDLRNNAVDKWVQPWSRVDFQARYTFENGLALTFDAQNLFDTHGYWATRGAHDGFQKDYVEAGRTFFLTASWRR